MHLIYGEIKMMSNIELVENISKKLDEEERAIKQSVDALKLLAWVVDEYTSIEKARQKMIMDIRKLMLDYEHGKIQEIGGVVK